MSSDYLSKVSKICQESTLATISHGYVSGLHGKTTEITTTWKQNDYVTNTTDIYTLTHEFDKNVATPQLLLKNSFPKLSSRVLIQSISPCFGMNAVIVKMENKDSKKSEYILKIWARLNGISKRKVINLSSFDQHGEVHSDSVFSSLQWSQDCNKLV